MRRSLLHGGVAPLAIALCVALAGCDSTTEAVDDAVACEGVRCTAGTCFSNAGQPSCRCGPWEESAGLVCQVSVFVVPDDHGGSPDEATPVTVEQGPAEGRISASTRGMSDRDLFTFTAKAGHTYVFLCEPQSLFRCQPRLLDSAGRHVGSFTFDGKRTAWLFTGLDEGRWYVEVSGDGGGTGTYTYQLMDLGLDDYGDFPERASGVVLRLLDASGRLVDTAEGLVARRLPRLELKAATSGSWFVQVSPTYGQVPLTFNCRLTDLGLDDHGDTAATATRLTPGVPMPVRMHSSKDVDALVFTAVVGRQYALRQQPALPVDVQLFDASGRLLGGSPPNAHLPLQGVAGTVHLKLMPPPGGVSDQPFQVVLEDLGPEDPSVSLQWVEGSDPGPWSLKLTPE